MNDLKSVLSVVVVGLGDIPPVSGETGSDADGELPQAESQGPLPMLLGRPQSSVCPRPQGCCLQGLCV